MNFWQFCLKIASYHFLQIDFLRINLSINGVCSVEWRVSGEIMKPSCKVGVSRSPTTDVSQRGSWDVNPALTVYLWSAHQRQMLIPALNRASEMQLKALEKASEWGRFKNAWNLLIYCILSILICGNIVKIFKSGQLQETLIYEKGYISVFIYAQCEILIEPRWQTS